MKGTTFEDHLAHTISEVEAPQPLATLQSFLNSYDRDDDIELLTDPEQAARALVGYGLLGEDEGLTEADVERARRFREALRTLLLAQSGADEDAVEAVAALQSEAARVRLGFAVSDDGDMALAPAHDGIDGAIAALMAVAHEAQLDGSWERLKACPEDSCRWIFYDSSRNRSGRWCGPRCGSRAKVRAYRARHN